TAPKRFEACSTERSGMLLKLARKHRAPMTRALLNGQVLERCQRQAVHGERLDLPACKRPGRTGDFLPIAPRAGDDQQAAARGDEARQRLGGSRQQTLWQGLERVALVHEIESPAPLWRRREKIGGAKFDAFARKTLERPIDRARDQIEGGHARPSPGQS